MKYFFEKWGVGKNFSLPQLTLLAIAIKKCCSCVTRQKRKVKFQEEYVLLVRPSKKNLYKGD